ncbi:MAG: hypothetical protein AAB465_02355 [Patescibacteria group bacterium]
MYSFASFVKFTIINPLLEILYFPIWWYTKGLKNAAFSLRDNVYKLARSLALRLLLANMFKPMFGQYSFSGRIISFFMRVLQLVVYLILFIIGAAILLVLFFAWLAILPYAVYQLIK